MPVRLGGLGIVNPTKLSSLLLLASINISAPLRDLILRQIHDSTDCLEAQINAKDTHKQNCDNAKTSAMTLRATISNSLQCAMDVTQEKGASSWLTSLFLEELASLSTKVPSETPLLSGLAGNHCTPPPHVLVAQTSLWSMHYHVQRAVSPQYDTMKSETLRQI